MLVIYLAQDMKVSAYTNLSVVAELKRATTLVQEPKFTPRYYRWHLLLRKASSNYDALL